MNARSKRCLSGAGILALLVLLTPAARAFGQEGEPPPASPAEVQPVAAASGTAAPLAAIPLPVRARSPLPFKPFEMRGPVGGAVAPDSVLTLPDGRRIRARRYFREINRLERDFNALGYSLRDPEPETKLGANTFDSAELVKRSEVRIAIPEAKEGAEKDSAPGTLPILWDREYGNPDLFAAEFHGSLDFKGTLESSTALGTATAGASVFGHDWDVVGVTTNLNAPKTGNLTGTFRIAVLGATICNLTPNQAVSWSASSRFSRSVDVSATVHFAVGPIPMTARAGFRGTGGAQYALNLSRASAEAWFRPALSATAYLQVGADIVVGGVGAGANLLLMDLMLDVYGLAALEVDAQQRPLLHVRTYALQNMSALKGTVYAYAWIYVPHWHYFYLSFHKKRWTYEIWDSPGIQVSNAYLFSQDRKIYL